MCRGCVGSSVPAAVAWPGRAAAWGCLDLEHGGAGGQRPRPRRRVGGDCAQGSWHQQRGLQRFDDDRGRARSRRRGGGPLCRRGPVSRHFLTRGKWRWHGGDAGSQGIGRSAAAGRAAHAHDEAHQRLAPRLAASRRGDPRTLRPHRPSIARRPPRRRPLRGLRRRPRPLRGRWPPRLRGLPGRRLGAGARRAGPANLHLRRKLRRTRGLR
mmetsp:Transcript_165438/g.530836  ORF Transcript_165438/g.530836 Transcript_165438/m.530836 type:complete len:211 (-) Transcript_165438:879-1511(-)